jgi:iron complex outermembrane receptor protein
MPIPATPARARLLVASRLALAASAAIGAGAAAAQDGVQLPTLTIEGDGNAGFFGETFAQSAAPVMKTDTPILETPRSVSVVTQQQMEERGARTLTEALQYSPGVFAGFGGNDNRGDWIKVRGFEPTIFLDGMQSYFGYYNNARPEPFLLSSVAVLKGPSGMLYGNGAVGGIVNEVSKLPDPAAPNIVQIEVGTDNLFQSGIDVGGTLGPDGRLLYRLVAFGRSADGPVDHSSDDAAAFMPSLTWMPTDATRITLLGFYQKNDTSPYIQFLSPYGTLWSAEEFANGDFLPNDVFVGEPGANYYNAERSAVTLFGGHRFNSTWSVAGSLRYTASSVDYAQMWWAYDNYETGRYNPDGTINRTGEIAENDSHAWVGDLHASASFTLGGTAHEAMFGVGFTDGRFNYDYGALAQRGPIDPFDPVYTGVIVASPIVDFPEYSLKQQSIYAQDRITWAERLHLDLGLRYDRIEQEAQDWAAPDTPQDLDDGELSTSVALLYAMENGVAPYVSYSESFYQEAVGTDAAGNPFEPTRGTQYEAGVKYQPPGTTALFTAAVFEIEKSNTLVTDPTNPNFQIQEGKAKSRGLELAAQADWRGFSIDAAYTYLDTEDEDGARFAGVPRDQASAWLQYEAGGRLSGLTGGVGVRYIGSTVNGEVTTPSVTLYDAMIGYEWDRYLLQLTGRNLADETYVVDCGGPDTSFTCYYGDPRTVGLSLTARF